MHIRSYLIIISSPSFENLFLNIELLLFIIVIIVYFNIFYLKCCVCFFFPSQKCFFYELLQLKFKLFVKTMFHVYFRNLTDLIYCLQDPHPEIRASNDHLR